MKIDSSRMWPYPVLRPDSDDYLESELQVTITPRRRKNSTEVRVFANFELSDPHLKELVESRGAQYTIVTRCPRTYWRQASSSECAEWDFTIPGGRLFGIVEFTPSVTLIEAETNFRSPGWHSDYDDFPELNLDPGSVLAIDDSYFAHVDEVQEAPLKSVVQFQGGGDKEALWDCDFEEDYAKIVLRNEDYLKIVNKAKTGSPDEKAYLMNSIYLNAIHNMLITGDQCGSDYQNLKWFRSLNAKLRDVKCAGLGSGADCNRLEDAQKLLRYPLGKLPLLQEIS